jgi:hypothetical protein
LCHEKKKSQRSFDTFANPHDLSRRCGKPTPFQALQQSQIFHPNGIPIFASILIYWRFFGFQYSPDFRSFGKNLI